MKAPKPHGQLLRAAALIPILLFLAGCTGPDAPSGSSPTTSSSATTAATPRFGHEHAVFRMFNATGQIRFDDASFDYSRTRYVRAHLHLSGPESSDAQYVVHAEGELGYDLHEFFSSLGVTIQETRIVLDTKVHGGTELANNQTHEWQLWVEPCKPPLDDWARKIPWTDFQPGQLDRMLLAFAPKDSTAHTLQAQAATVPSAAELEQRYQEECPGT